MKKKNIVATLFLAIALVTSVIAGMNFNQMKKIEPIVSGPGVSEIRMLSDYSPGIKGTSSDTEIYVLEGKEKGGTTLILGGTHPNETAAYLAAVMLIENLIPEVGTVYVIPRANASAFTHNDPQEASPQSLSIETLYGERTFRYGSRATNPINQWPDPDVYIHAASGQQLSGSETRNLNRGYPGRLDGTITEQVCYGITNLINTDKIDLTFDYHEASPEYPVINAIVAHERAMKMAADVVINMQIDGLNFGLEPSPTNLRGLTHRELGDYTDTLAILMETSNPSQGRLRGKTDAELVLEGKDDGYIKAAEQGYIYVPFDEKGHPISERIARHSTATLEFFKVFSKMNPDKPIVVSSVPSYDELIDNGIGHYLLEVN